MTGNADEAARKVRRTAETESKRGKKKRQTDPQSAEAHNELTHPKHSKGRPTSDKELGKRGKSGGSRGSNTGNDGP